MQEKLSSEILPESTAGTLPHLFTYTGFAMKYRDFPLRSSLPLQACFLAWHLQRLSTCDRVDGVYVLHRHSLGRPSSPLPMRPPPSVRLPNWARSFFDILSLRLVQAAILILMSPYRSMLIMCAFDVLASFQIHGPTRATGTLPIRQPRTQSALTLTSFKHTST